jgi:hypothetical protein
MKTMSFIASTTVLLMGSAAIADTTGISSGTDFSDFYVGGSVGKITSGDGTYIYGGSPGDFYALEGNSYGVYGGYNWQATHLFMG